MKMLLFSLILAAVFVHARPDPFDLFPDFRFMFDGEIGDQCIKHADRGPFEMEIGSCCGFPGEISCGPGYVLEAPIPDKCGGSCPDSWCNHRILKKAREYSCVPGKPIEIGDQCVKHADRGSFGMEIGSCCGLPGEISCGPGYTVKAPAVDVCGGSCPETWCNHHGVLANVREYSCEPSEFVQVYGEGSCETLGGYKTITDALTCEMAAKFLDKHDITVNIHKMHGPENRPLGCTYHQSEILELWTESTGVCTFGEGCLCEITENIIKDQCIKHADRGPLEMEIGSCCGLPGEITCGPGYVLQAPVPDVCGGSCPDSWCNHRGTLSNAREFSCVPEPSTEESTESQSNLCKPYSPEQCRIAAEALGLVIGGKGYAFEGDYRQKGCYAYTSGKYAGRVYYGLGGSDAEITDPVPFRPETYRPNGWDCKGSRKL